MSTPQHVVNAAQNHWDRYRNNFSRHLIGVSRYMQTRMMNTLQQECGHEHLRLGFAPYITLIDGQGSRLSDLADRLSISRQACNQAVKQIESAGYIGRQADPADGRAKQLVLTAQGEKLRRDGARIVRDADQLFAEIAGASRTKQTARTLGKLHKQLALGGDQRDGDQLLYGGMGGLLPRLSDYTMQRLMALTAARGHSGLKLSFAQVLTLVGPAGGRIQQIAAIQDVSKQAISATALELEELGYLQRETDPQDARQILLHFTPAGERLIADSVDSVAELEAEFSALTGQRDFASTKQTLAMLYEGLCLERDVFDQYGTTDITELAQQLQQRFGPEACQALARLLLNPDIEKR